MFVDETCSEYCQLEYWEEALKYFLEQNRIEQAKTYLDTRPNMVLPLDTIENMVRDESRKLILWTLPNEHLEIFFHLIHSCLYQGREMNRQDRIAAVLATLPKQYCIFSPLYDELGEMLIELRLINAIVSLLSVIWNNSMDNRHSAFLDRLKETGEQNADRELQLCMLICKPKLLDEGLKKLKLTEKNCLLFAHSPSRYKEAIQVLQRVNDYEEAVLTCRRHGDDELAQELLQESNTAPSGQ